MGRELEALDALLQGLLVYDTINTDAEAYEVTTEVDELKTMICSTLETKYHLDFLSSKFHAISSLIHSFIILLIICIACCLKKSLC